MTDVIVSELQQMIDSLNHENALMRLKLEQYQEQVGITAQTKNAEIAELRIVVRKLETECQLLRKRDPRRVQGEPVEVLVEAPASVPLDEHQQQAMALEAVRAELQQARRYTLGAQREVENVGAKLTESAARYDQLLTTYKKLLHKYNDTRDAFEQFKAKVAWDSSQLAGLEERLRLQTREHENDRGVWNKKRASLESSLERIKQQIENSQRVKNPLEGTVADLRERVHVLQQERTELLRKVTALEAKVQSTEASARMTSKDNVDSLLQQLRIVQDGNATKERELNALRALVAEREERITNLEEDINEVTNLYWKTKKETEKS
jgi:chromosome segregation ATPase